MAKNLIKLIVIVLIVTGLPYLTYWLWQRQPKNTPSEEYEAVQMDSSRKEMGQNFEISPKNEAVIAAGKTKIEGLTTPDSLVLIYSNDITHVALADGLGKFSQSIELENGLNLIILAAIDKNNNLSQNQTLTYWVEAENKTGSANVFAGSVKNIFDNLITLLIQDGQRTISINKSTEIILPKNGQDTATEPAVRAIRIGDYASALGNLNSQGELIAKRLEIIRENKPQITTKFAKVKILTNLKRNVFSAKDEKTAQNLEFAIDKNTKVQDLGNVSEAKQVTKDRQAIIFFKSVNAKNTASLIYLLP